MSDKEKIVAMTEQEFIKLMTIVMYACYLCGDNIIICRTEEDAKKIFSGIVDACLRVPIANEVESNGTKIIISKGE